METLYYSQMDSSIGRLNVAVSDKGLVVLAFDRDPFPPKKSRYRWEESDEQTAPFIHELREYLGGERRGFSFALAPGVASTRSTSAPKSASSMEQ